MRYTFLFFFGLLLAQSVAAADLFGTVDAVSGEASLTGENGASTRITAESKIYTGQSIRTGADGEVVIVTADSGIIALRPNSSFRVEQYQAKGESTDQVVFSLFKGALRSITGWIAKRNPSAYRLNAISTTIGVRGTDHETTIIEATSGRDLSGTFDTVYEGITVMQNQNGSVEVHAGEHAFSPREARQAPGLLAQKPEFMEHRSLKLESRIPRLRENLQLVVRNKLEASTADKPDDNTSDNKAVNDNRREKIIHRIENRRQRNQ